MRRIWQMLLVLFVFFAGPSAVFSDSSNTRIAGTFSSLRFIEEAGDLLGEELRIVFTNKGYEGMFQVAEGEPGSVMVFPVEVDGNRIKFSFKGEGNF